MTQNRPSRTGLALAAVGAMIFVGGTLWSVLSAEEAEIEGERPRPPLEEVMAGSDLVLRGVTEDVMRLGEPRDAGVRATLDVDEVLSTSEEQAPTEVVIYDRGFRESWSEGQEMVVFLGAEGGLPQGAEFRVVERCILEEGSLPCPYDLDEI
jgi:hypothetical protein